MMKPIRKYFISNSIDKLSGNPYNLAKTKIKFGIILIVNITKYEAII
ncbi:MAG: hypothetical protein IJA34_07575 [Lachnospiraceae bacterium]|nr:hypothetical protein [Lachnospiraceae bacterium]